MTTATLKDSTASQQIYKANIPCRPHSIRMCPFHIQTSQISNLNPARLLWEQLIWQEQ